jgi:hypothetical protein
VIAETNATGSDEPRQVRVLVRRFSSGGHNWIHNESPGLGKSDSDSWSRLFSGRLWRHELFNATRQIAMGEETPVILKHVRPYVSHENKRFVGLI